MTTPIEAGDLFRDNDKRHGGRIVRVVEIDKDLVSDLYRIVNVEHWNEALIGRHTWVSETTLLSRFTKWSH